jgi:hypothetical protein
MFLIAGGRIASVRTLPEGEAGAVELRAGLAQAALHVSTPSYDPADADELLTVAAFLRRPGPELRVLSLEGGDLAAGGLEVSEILAA